MPLLRPSLASPEVLGQAHGYQVEHAPLGPPTEPNVMNTPSQNLGQNVPERMVAPPSTPESADHQSLSTGLQPGDLAAAVYAVKAKTKVPSTWEAGSTSQSKLPPAERSLDPGESKFTSRPSLGLTLLPSFKRTFY